MSPPPDRILLKICGVTTPGDAVACVELGADLLGLNFYSRSPRNLSRERAQEIARAVAGRLPLVGVFVDAPPAAAELAAWAGAWGFLFDSPPGGRGGAEPYGGSGRSWEWESLAGLATDKPVLLAGGIGPDNASRAAAVARALAKTAPAGLDVCSRIESSPGIKDRGLLERLFREVRDGQA